MNPDLFAGRYEFLQEAPAGAGGRLFEARDAQSGTIVALKVFRRELEADAPERQDLQQLLDAARKCTHPGVLRYHSVSMDEGYLVREWVHGFCVMDLLRRRRELPAEELVALFDSLPEALDTANAAGIIPATNLITRLFIGWDRSVSVEEMARLRDISILNWRGFTLKLNPLAMSEILPMAWDETMNTISGDVLPIASALGPCVSFAETVYELLGAPHRGTRGRRYIPISTLSEGGNAVLRRIITGQGKPPTCLVFWKELLDASDLKRPEPPRPPVLPPPLPVRPSIPVPPTEPPIPVARAVPVAAPPPPPPVPAEPPLPPRRTLVIPDHCLSAVQRGTIARLTPRDVSFTPIHLIARPVFRIGRSLYHADFITRILPETAENEKLTKEIGRVHTIVEVRDGKIFLRDGNGEQASVNGSRLDEVQLSHDQPTRLERKGILSLYRNYELEVAPLLSSADRGCEIINESAWSGPVEPAPSITGAVAFRPLHNQSSLRQAAWLFTRLDFCVSARGDVIWCEAGSPSSQATFLHHRGQFWLANFSLPNGTMALNQASIGQGNVVPMTRNQAVTIGPGSYVIEVQ